MENNDELSSFVLQNKKRAQSASSNESFREALTNKPKKILKTGFENNSRSGQESETIEHVPGITI